MNTKSTLRNKTIVGIAWTFMEQVSKVGIQTVTTLILAWFLLPEDFGLIAMITVFFAIGNSLMDSGFSQALIRKKDATLTDYSTAFYSNLILGLVAYMLLYVSAPLISNFYDEQRLTMLVRVVGFVIIINSFKIVQVAQLTRDLNFKIQFKVALLSSITSAIIAIYLASLGFGAWSLAAQMLVAALAGTILYWIVNDWRPIKSFSKESLSEMLGFGSKLFLSGLIDTTFQNIYVIVIGKLFIATYVGYYFFAQQIQRVIVHHVTNSVQKVTYPALSIVQDDNKALKSFNSKIIQIVTYIISPSVIALIVLADPLFNVLLKDNWLPAVPYLQLMCIAGLFYPLHAINLNILKVKGRSDLFLYLEVIKKIMVVVVLSISAQFGIFGILVGMIATSVLSYIPNSYYSVKLIDYTLFEQLRDFIPTVLLSVIMGVTMYLAGMMLPFGNITYIIVTGFVGIIVYISLNYLMKTPSQLLVSEIIKDKFNKRF